MLRCIATEALYVVHLSPRDEHIVLPWDERHAHSLTLADLLINLAPFPDAGGPKWSS